MELSNYAIFILSIFAAINILAFLIMLIDKIKSVNSDHQRISEGMMFFLASVFGSLGIYLGMFIFRHKTTKWFFLIGVPLLILENLALVYVIYLIMQPNFSLL